MNFKKWTTALMLALAVSSCIQDEALNSEAAIDACTGADVQLAHINSDSKEINIYVHKGANLANSNCCLRCPTVPPSRQTNIHRMTSLTITISATSLTPAPLPSLPKTANGPLPIP